MAAVTIKDIPDALYEKLSAEEIIERARKVRPSLRPDMPGHDEIMNAIEEGRSLQSPFFAEGDFRMKKK